MTVDEQQMGERVKPVRRTEINATYFGGSLRDSVDVVRASDYDRLIEQRDQMREALKAWEHWYSVDSSEFNRDMARDAGRKALKPALALGNTK